MILLREGRQPTIWLVFPENCLKMKFWPPGGGGGTRPSRPLDPQMQRPYLVH